MPRPENEVPNEAQPPQVVIAGIPVPIFFCLLVGGIVLMNVLKFLLPAPLCCPLVVLTVFLVGQRFRSRD